MADVVNLRGDRLGPQDGPWQNVVAECERLLEMARAGHIQGVHGAIVHRDGSVTEFISGRYGPSAIGCLEIAKARMARDMIDE